MKKKGRKPWYSVVSLLYVIYRLSSRSR
uniref:Uncharacterized protein n=1 Tax=Arundo donax TaxID=35708 RepID=A0A0A8XVD1_ARUDO